MSLTIAWPCRAPRQAPARSWPSACSVSALSFSACSSRAGCARAAPRSPRRRAAGKSASAADRAGRRSERARRAAAQTCPNPAAGTPWHVPPRAACRAGCDCCRHRHRSCSATRAQVKSRRKAISSAKMPNASVTAKPKIRRPNWPSAADGLRSAPCRNWPKRLPTPIAAAPVPMAARPAPMSLRLRDPWTFILLGS